MWDLYKIRSKNNFGFVLFFTLASISFFNVKYIYDAGLNFYNLIYLGTLAIAAFHNFKYFSRRKNDNIFGLPITLLLIAIMLSILSASVIRDQPLYLSFIAALFPVFGYLFYFYFSNVNEPVRSIEKVIIVIGTLYIILFAISFKIYPRKVLIFQDFEDDRGAYRVIINGVGFLFLLFFLAVTKLFTQDRIKWLIVAVVTFACILLTLERLYIISSALVGGGFIILRQKPIMKIVTVLCIAGIIVLVTSLNAFKILSKKTSGEVGYVHQNVRIQSAKYFLDAFQIPPLTPVLGNGFAYGNESAYGRQLDKLHNKYFWVEDLGFVGLYVYLGILSLVAYGLIYFKILRTKIAKGNEYAQLFMLFILINGLTNYGTYNANFLLCVVMSLYVIQQARTKNKVTVVVSLQPVKDKDDVS